MINPARERWKLVYRMQRIIRRETGKAWMDMMLYGTSFMLFDEHGPQRIDPRDIVIKDGKPCLKS